MKDKINDVKGEIAVCMAGWLAKRINPLVGEMESRGYDVSVICFTAVDRDLMSQKQRGVLKEAISVSEVFDRFWEERSQLRIDEVVEKGKENEAYYQVPLMDLIKADRHMGRGFIKGAWYPRSLLSETLHYYEYLDIINRMVAYFESFFSRHDFGVLLTEVASFPTKAACVVARSKGIEIRIPHPSRTGNLYFFAHNEFIEIPPLEEEYHRVLKSTNKCEWEESQPSGEESYGLAKSEIGGYLEYRSIRKAVWGMIQQLLYQLYRRIKRYSVYSPYYVRDRIKAVWRYHRGIKEFENRKFPKLDQFAGKDYLFCPLQLEPESAMMVMSPEFSHQEYLVHVIASNLPAGWSLVVKEHPLALGTRPPGFYDNIEAYPNVVMVSPFDSAREWYSKSQAVGMITGSVGYEAALEGIPVISFGYHNFIRVLEHVFVVNSHESIRDAISYIKNGKINNENIRKIQGLILRKVLIENSFSYSAGIHAEENREKAEEKMMAVFVDKLLESLEMSV